MRILPTEENKVEADGNYSKHWSFEDESSTDSYVVLAFENKSETNTFVALIKNDVPECFNGIEEIEDSNNPNGRDI